MENKKIKPAMIKIQCEICTKIFDIKEFYGGNCPNCNQEYRWDSDVYKIRLTTEQKFLLRAMKKEVLYK
jgi:hypothetical protein